MFFFLSKTLNVFTMPIVIICICFLVSVFIKNVKWKKRLFWSALILLLFISNDFIANEVMRVWEIPAKKFSEMKKYDLGIVLTGTTISGQKPDDRVYFSRGADRVYHTVQLYKLGFIKKILVSGGTGLLKNIDDPEALKVKAAMQIMGVPESDIFTESKTRNTYESAGAVKTMLAELGYNKNDCVLITSAFHMRRSLACYRKAGLDVDNFTTDFYAHSRYYNFESFFVPDVDAIIIWHKLVKEWVGFTAYKVAEYI